MRHHIYTRVVACLLGGAFLFLAFNNCSGGGPTSTDVSSQSGPCTVDASLRNPTTIEQTTRLINALPKPLTLPCFIESLDKPLKVFALESTGSAQPSDNANTPRVFIIKDKLILSVVPTGVGKNLLEMSQYINSTESVKGELEFPLAADIPASRPYDHIRNGSTTTCKACHSGEHQITGFAGVAFASAIVKPDAFKRLPVTQMVQTTFACNAVADPYRCELMRAVFVNGLAEDANFP